MARSQVPNLAHNSNAVITTRAWRSKPSWMLVAGSDRTINPDLERWYATQANSHKVEVSGASHAVYVSRPKEVAALIEEAVSHARQKNSQCQVSSRFSPAAKPAAFGGACRLGPARAASSLKPDLNLVAIRIGDVRVGEARSKLTATEQPPTGALDFRNGAVDVVRVHEPKTEMRHAANRAGRAGVLRERQDVVPSGRLRVNEAIPAPVLTQTKDLLVEPQCTLSVSNRKVDMREAIRGNHESSTFPVINRRTLYGTVLLNH